MLTPIVYEQDQDEDNYNKRNATAGGTMEPYQKPNGTLLNLL